MEDCGRWLLSGVDELELMSVGDVMSDIFSKSAMGAPVTAPWCDAPVEAPAVRLWAKRSGNTIDIVFFDRKGQRRRFSFVTMKHYVC